MEFGIQIAGMEPRRFREVAQTAEQLGYDFIVFPDHIVMEGPEKQYDAHALAYDHVVIAAAAIEATKKIRVGHLVLCNLFRHPALTAQTLMTLDHLSNGRLLAGLGTGWTETEFRMTGIPFPPIAERIRMLDEALTVIRSLWTNERTTFNGEFYKLNQAILWPKPIQKPHPPIIIGGGGKGLLRIGAQHAAYINIIPDAGRSGKISLANIKRMNETAYRNKVAFVRDEAKRHGRNPDELRISSFVTIFQLTSSKDETQKIAGLMAPAFGLTPDAFLQSPLGLLGTPEECVTEMRRRIKDWGVSHFVFTGQIGNDDKLLRRLKEEVLQHL